MANRYLHDQRSLDREMVTLRGVVTFGASGAVASQDCLGFTVTKPAGTGLYRITLEDDWYALLGASLMALGVAPVDGKYQLQVVNLPAKTIDFQYVGGAAAANAVSGDRVFITLDLRNTSTPRRGGSS